MRRASAMCLWAHGWSISRSEGIRSVSSSRETSIVLFLLFPMVLTLESLVISCTNYTVNYWLFSIQVTKTDLKKKQEPWFASICYQVKWEMPIVHLQLQLKDFAWLNHHFPMSIKLHHFSFVARSKFNKKSVLALISKHIFNKIMH